MHAMATQRYPASILFAVSVIWNGTVVTGPILIYHDEITDDLTTVPTVGNSNGPGDLVCRSENHEEARWRHPRGLSVPTGGNYRQVRSAAGVPSLSRLSTPIDGEEPTRNDVIVNGLWICQVVNSDIPVQDILENFNYVGIYNRGDGEVLGIKILRCILIVADFKNGWERDKGELRATL